MHNIYYCIKLGAKYTGIENVTLNAQGIFGGETHILPMFKESFGFIKLNASIKYDHKVNDMFTVSPKFETIATFTKISKSNFESKLVINPKLSTKYSHKDNFVVTGAIETPIKFKSSKFDNVTVKTSLNIKYIQKQKH